LTNIKIQIGENEENFEILEVLEFSSERKKMSIIVKDKEGKVFLFTKGADSAILPTTSEDSKQITEQTNQHLHEFGEEGLRNLMVGMKEIKENLQENLNQIHEARIITDPIKKEEELAKAFENLERDIDLLGVVSLEDKIEEGVPDCLESLKEAGIKIWVLTGDKLDTAENISYACSLIHEDTEKFRIYDYETNMKEKVLKCLEQLKQSKSTKTALLVEGKIALNCILEDIELTEEFVKSAVKCQTVIFCRATPKQKGDIVKLMKRNMRSGTISLAVGDGGNDVSMIQSANIGVGIIGNEGRQAANASDFAIPKFRFLKRLLLTHG
jgi:magnesium-transporting ATPase (P-type)